MAGTEPSGAPADAAERRTLFEVEREKRWRVWLLFALLLALAFVTAWVACLIVLGVAYLVLPLVGPPAWLFSLAGVGSGSRGGARLPTHSGPTGHATRLLKSGPSAAITVARLCET